jgi:hypothetical protein
MPTKDIAMQALAYFSIAVWTCVAAGCSAGSAKTAAEPIGFTFESAAGSFASFGWSGFIHDVVEPVGTQFGVKTTDCQDGVCGFEGPTDPGGVVNRKRCLFRMSTMCSTDADCPVPEGTTSTPCVYIYDSPITQPLKGSDDKIGACAWSYLPIAAADQPPTISGTLNLNSGVLQLDNLTVLLPLNVNVDKNGLSVGSYRGACAVCVGDKASNDGVRDGHCEIATELGDPATTAGADNSPDAVPIGLPCDVNRPGVGKANYSMDCSPTVVFSYSPPLQFGGSFISAGTEVAIKATSPKCTNSEDQCFCAMCSDGVTACTEDRDCGTGQKCAAPTSTECDPYTTADLPLAKGTFLNQCKKDPKRFAVFGNNCTPEAGCAWDGVSAVGTCTSKVDGSTIGCYPSKLGAVISAPGQMTRDDHLGAVYEANTANARCIAAGSSPLAAQSNSQLGFPGLLFQKRNFRIYPTYAGDK